MHGPSGKSFAALPTAAGGLTRLAHERAREAGLDTGALLSKVGLSEVQILDRAARIKVRQQIDFVELVAHAVNDPFLGFHLGLLPDLRELGLIYYVLASSDTFGEAWRRGARYTGMINEGISLRYRDGDEIWMEIGYVGVPRHIDRHQIEFCMTALVRLCRQLTGRELLPGCVRFAHHRNQDASELSAFFGCKVEFGMRADIVAFEAAVRSLPILTADPYLNELLIANAEEALARRPRPHASFRSEVENAMAQRLPHGSARAGDIARTLGVSQRTLARRLAAEGATFSDVLEGLRSDLALRYLTDDGLTISQVAWLVGYQEISAFTHAFKRWTGMTPREARAGPELVPA
jgi:AraC-like DNA-binding protein